MTKDNWALLTFLVTNLYTSNQNSWTWGTKKTKFWGFSAVSITIS